MKFVLALIASSVFAVNAGAAGLSTSSFDDVNNKSKTNQIGVGLAIGSLNGITAQYWLSNDRAVDATLASERGNTAVLIFPRKSGHKYHAASASLS